MTLSVRTTENGILEDERNIQRGVAGAVQQLSAQAELMLQLSAFLFDDYHNNGATLADQEHLASVTQKFQQELSKLIPIMAKFSDIESLGNAENGAANLASVITKHSIDVSKFTDRYK